jgi:septum formation protein
MTIVLASSSAIRRQLLHNAGIAFSAVAASVDEDALKANLEKLAPGELAVSLADAKALSLCDRYPEDLIIGADQVLNLEGKALGKPRNFVEAEAQLRAMRGHTHRLETAISCARSGAIIWRHLARPALIMREFSDDFLGRYLAETGERAMTSAGSYQLESLGVQLFDVVDGDYFAILGLPLLPLLAFLRSQGLARP